MVVGRPRVRLPGVGGAKVCGWLVGLVVSVESGGPMRSSVWLYTGAGASGGGTGGGDCSRWYSNGHVSVRIELAMWRRIWEMC